jgi:hypothetical protein
MDVGLFSDNGKIEVDRYWIRIVFLLDMDYKNLLDGFFGYWFD